MLARSITIHDETALGKVLNTYNLPVSQDVLTVADLIRLRVEHEVADYNERLPDTFQALVQPTDAERVLNGYQIRNKRLIDSEKQVYVALDAFQKNGFFILIDNHQAETLDETIAIRPTTTISFIKLTPLIGG
ncbi:hypothetical protein GCM10028806_44460 [Spirosoma terrae]|uniref:Uncharacterized protein n=1 Tax=Spirosoma terrae TaxID=1968276 RepID=A0A6L9L078_9BACT|nr:hypothetical protein [Spirosoma terrae]NDU93886.1 hypothetical protein [Spirosoma terrae]